MIVYFVRHGETALNARGVHQFPDTPLSKKGIRQAKQLAVFFKNKNVDAVYASDLPRATNTASTIANALSVPLTESELLREIQRPSALFGKLHYHPKTFLYVLSMIFHRNDPAWRFEDAEALPEVHARAEEVGKMLGALSTTSKSIVVVSHAVFLEILLQNLCKKGALNFVDYFPIFSPFSRIKNASVSEYHCHGNVNEVVCAWEQRTFNDTAHLRA